MYNITCDNHITVDGTYYTYRVLSEHTSSTHTYIMRKSSLLIKRPAPISVDALVNPSRCVALKGETPRTKSLKALSEFSKLQASVKKESESLYYSSGNTQEESPFICCMASDVLHFVVLHMLKDCIFEEDHDSCFTTETWAMVKESRRNALSLILTCKYTYSVFMSNFYDMRSEICARNCTSVIPYDLQDHDTPYTIQTSRECVTRELINRMRQFESGMALHCASSCCRKSQMIMNHSMKSKKNGIIIPCASSCINMAASRDGKAIYIHRKTDSFKRQHGTARTRSRSDIIDFRTVDNIDSDIDKLANRPSSPFKKRASLCMPQKHHVSCPDYMSSCEDGSALMFICTKNTHMVEAPQDFTSESFSKVFLWVPEYQHEPDIDEHCVEVTQPDEFGTHISAQSGWFIDRHAEETFDVCDSLMSLDAYSEDGEQCSTPKRTTSVERRYVFVVAWSTTYIQDSGQTIGNNTPPDSSGAYCLCAYSAVCTTGKLPVVSKLFIYNPVEIGWLQNISTTRSERRHHRHHQLQALWNVWSR